MDGSSEIVAARIAVLVSGNGTNLQALIDAINGGQLRAEIGLVLSNRSKSLGLERAKKAGIPTAFLGLKTYLSKGPSLDRRDYMREIARIIRSYFTELPDLVVLAGWMLIVTDDFIDTFKGRVINIHPALPQEFDGLNAIERAFKAFKHGKIKRTGVMIHKVVPKIDSGEVIISEEVPILDTDTLETLEDRIHRTEHILIVKAVRRCIGDLNSDTHKKKY